MNWNTVITILSTFGAMLAWIAKIRWSKEYAQAKDETIKSKDAQIQLLERTIQTYKDFSPEVIWRQYESVKKASDEYIKVNDEEKNAAQLELSKLRTEIEKEKLSGQNRTAELEKKYYLLEKEKDNLENELNIMRSNPGGISGGTIISASGSSLAISTLLNRGTEESIKQVAIPFINSDVIRDQFNKLNKSNPNENKIKFD